MLGISNADLVTGLIVSLGVTFFMALVLGVVTWMKIQEDKSTELRRKQSIELVKDETADNDKRIEAVVFLLGLMEVKPVNFYTDAELEDILALRQLHRNLIQGKLIIGTKKITDG